MAGWFNRVRNPAWHRISSLNTREAFELSIILYVHGFVRRALEEEFVVPFEKLGRPHALDKVLEGSFGPLVREVRKIWPINRDLKERLIDELELGF
jgi:hypothetical protein